MLPENITVGSVGKEKSALRAGFSGISGDLLAGIKIQQAALDNTRFMLDALPQMAWSANRNGEIEILNSKWYAYFGLPESTYISCRKILSFLHPADLVKMQLTWNAAKTTGTVFEMEYRWLRASDNSYRWHSGRAVPVKDNSGKIIQWIGTCTDIEDQKQAELARLLQQEEVRQIQDDLDSFIYVASHDLKLPVVNTVALFTELLGTVQFKDSEGLRMVQMIKESLNQIQDTIQDLGEIVKVQRAINTNVANVDIASVLEEVKNELADEISASGAIINANFKEVTTIRFSQQNFKNVLYNLVSNAVKFRDGSRELRITIKSWKRDSSVCLSVSDNGVGLDTKRYGDKLFQMFRRFHNHVPGAGLGLYLVHRVMKNNGGSVEVKSKPGKGAAFTLCFNQKNENGYGE